MERKIKKILENYNNSIEYIKEEVEINYNKWTSECKSRLDKTHFLLMRCFIDDFIKQSNRTIKDLIQAYKQTKREEFKDYNLLNIVEQLDLISQFLCTYEPLYVRKRIKTSVRKRLFLEQDCCKFCSSKDCLEIDHIIPVSRGGTNDYENLQILCKICNAKKKDKILEE